jgi:hypothetical protein
MRDALHILQPDDLGLAWPRLVVRAPLTVTPDRASIPVQFSAAELPAGCTLEFTCLGRRRGRPASEVLTTTPVGLTQGRVALNGGPITLAPPTAEGSGTLDAPEDRHTLALVARVVNPYGETIGFARATVTAQVQPLGILETKNAASDTSLKQLLDNLKLEYKGIKLTGDLENDKETLSPWRLLVVEGKLDQPDADYFRTVMASLDTPPVLLFAGADAAATGAGNQTLLSAPLVQGQARTVAIMSDVSDSMSEEAEGRTLRRWDMARLVAAQLNPGLLLRNTNRIVAPFKFIHLNPDGPITDFTRCPIGVYAGVSDDERRSGHWELAHHLVFAAALLDRDPTLSDVITTFDPTDCFNGRELPDWARKAAEKLVNNGVRLHLIAAGKLTDNSRNELGAVAFDRVIATTEWVKADGVSPTTVTSDDEMIHLIKVYLFQRMFPRLEVVSDSKGIDSLTGKGKDALVKYVADRAGQIKLINALAPFQGRQATAAIPSAWPAPVVDRVVLWLKHWQTTEAVSPLLLKDVVDLGPGRAKAVAFHLAIDLGAENAATEDQYTPERDALAGLMVRVLSAISGEWVAPTIHFAPRGTGFFFYQDNLKPFTIQPKAAPDWVKVKGVGLGCRILSGHGQGNRDFVADTRGLEMPWLAPRGLDPAHPSLVRLVIEDKNPAVGRLAIDLPLTAPPPWPVVAPIDVKQIVTPPAVNASQSGAAPLGLPARTLAAVIATAWLLLAVYTWRGL